MISARPSLLRALLILLLAALFALVPLPTQAAPAPAAAAPAAGATTAKGPAMWRITGAKSRIYLFGTVHLLPKGTVWQTPAMEAAMADTKITVVEADIESAYARSTMMMLAYEYGRNPSWQTLRGVLGAERYAKFAAAAKHYGVSVQNMEPMRPWLAIMQISSAALNAAGFEREHGVERTVLAAAKRANDKIRALETVEAQVKALAKLDGEDMLANVDREIAELYDVEHTLKPMVEAWAHGDVAAVDRLSVATMRAEAPALYRALLLERNANWVDVLTRWHAGEGTYFVAVGAAHLAGPDSVVAMLAKKGIKAERVQ